MDSRLFDVLPVQKDINIKHLLDVDCKHNIAGYEIKLKSQMPTLQIIRRPKMEFW